MAYAYINYHTHRANWQYPKTSGSHQATRKRRQRGSPNLAPFYEDPIRETIERFEAAGSPVITDEQRKYHNFATYCVHGLPNTAPDGFKIPFSDGHTRRLSQLTSEPGKNWRWCGGRRLILN